MFGGKDDYYSVSRHIRRYLYFSFWGETRRSEVQADRRVSSKENMAFLLSSLVL